MVEQGKTYCTKCGNPMEVGQVTCPTCGEVNSPVAASGTKMETPLGVLILGGLQILFSLVVVIAVFSSPALSTVFGAGIGIFIAVMLILPLIFGIFFIMGYNFARILMIIGAILDIISIVGIIWGIILLWYLTRPNVVAFFHQGRTF
ncbi:MAG: zinc ribbon domain-containing protein [Candidatus Thermoplasmatota archaeon]|jgi:hypothetical protein|nr:zinc ribbon domain-containing protein [Candidatus Thermoplasmatota archaeon]